MNHFGEDNLSALQSIEQAQRIAFAPIIFQAALAMRDFGLMEKLDAAEPTGLTLDELCQDTPLSRYGVRVLVEASLGIGLVTTDDTHYKLTKTGHYLLHDEMTRVNMDFVQDICYRGMFSLKESIETGKPEGLVSERGTPSMKDWPICLLRSRKAGSPLIIIIRATVSRSSSRMYSNTNRPDCWISVEIQENGR